MELTLGQLADVMHAAEALAPLEIGNIDELRRKVQHMPTEELRNIVGWITGLRRVKREWDRIPFTIKVEEKQPV